jgi:hypothetical protein
MPEESSFTKYITGKDNFAESFAFTYRQNGKF